MDMHIDLTLQRLDFEPQSRARALPRRPLTARLKPVLDVVSNSAVAVGVLFLLGAGGGLGTPAGPAGGLAGLGLVIAGLLATILPAQIRRRSGWAHTAQLLPSPRQRVSSRAS